METHRRVTHAQSLGLLTLLRAPEARAQALRRLERLPEQPDQTGLDETRRRLLAISLASTRSQLTRPPANGGGHG